MKPKVTILTSRCSYRTAVGRQCRQLAADAHLGLCPHHLDLHKQKEFADLTQPLLMNWQGFQTAQGVNFALSNLYKLLAANRISARRASVLAYISSLLLRSFPAIDADRAAGVVDPTKELTQEEVPDESEEEDLTEADAAAEELQESQEDEECEETENEEGDTRREAEELDESSAVEAETAVET